MMSRKRGSFSLVETLLICSRELSFAGYRYIPPHLRFLSPDIPLPGPLTAWSIDPSA